MSIYSINGNPCIRIYQPVVKPKEDKVTEFFKNSSRFISDTFSGLSSSRVIRAIVLGSGALGGFVVVGAAVSYLGLTLPGWVTLAGLIGTVVLGVLYGALSGGSASWKCKDIIQELKCEWGAFLRLFRSNYNEIQWMGKEAPGKIFLGSMPNRMSNSHTPGKIAQKEHLFAVLSINAPGSIAVKGERGCFGLMHAPAPQDWQEQGLAYAEIDCADHVPLSCDQLDAAADFIHFVVEKGGHIYVHCKAGQGRSAMAIAAYIMKYESLSYLKAVSIIETCRPSTTLHKPAKMARFKEYQQELGHRRAARASALNLLV